MRLDQATFTFVEKESSPDLTLPKQVSAQVGCCHLSQVERNRDDWQGTTDLGIQIGCSSKGSLPPVNFTETTGKGLFASKLGSFSRFSYRLLQTQANRQTTTLEATSPLSTSPGQLARDFLPPSSGPSAGTPSDTSNKGDRVPKKLQCIAS